MAERRSMGTALTLTPEQMAFIAGDVDPSQASMSSQVTDSSVQTMSHGDTVAKPPEPLRDRRKITQPVKRRHDSTGTNRDLSGGSDSLLGTILVPLTTRLQPRTAEALRRACLEQKLLRRLPASQQEIVESAVRAWLETNSYLQSDSV